VADADNLAWKLAAVQRGQAAPALLDSYEDERLEAARENVRVTNRTARFLRPADGIERVYRDAAIALAKRHPFARALVNTGRMAVANPYTRSRICQYTPGSAAGQSVQNVEFRWANGRTGRMNQLLDWAGGDLLLLCFGALSAAALRRLREVLATTPLRAVQVPAGRESAQADEHVRDPKGHLRGACGLPAGDEPAWALVRPDGYLAASGGAIDGRLVQAIGLTLGLTGVHA